MSRFDEEALLPNSDYDNECRRRLGLGEKVFTGHSKVFSTSCDVIIETVNVYKIIINAFTKNFQKNVINVY